MKKFATVLAAAALALSLSAVCFAQSAGPSGTAGALNAPAKHRGGAYNERIIAAALKEILPTLNLSTDQQTQIDALNSRTHDQMVQIRKDTKGDKVARKDKMVQLGEDYHKQLFTILNPEQTKQFKKEFKGFMKQWRQEHSKKKNAAAGSPPSNP